MFRGWSASLINEDGAPHCVVGSRTDEKGLEPLADAFYRVATRAIVSIAMAARALP
jgi:hypothetical protein